MGWQQIALLGRVWAILLVPAMWGLTAKAQDATATEATTGGDGPVCWSTASASSSTGGQETLPARKYLLGPGDRVRISIHQRADLPTEFDIREDGYISFPQIGQMRAAGMNLLALEESVSKAAEAAFGRAIPVSVEVISRRPLFVVGLVNTPGVYPYTVGLTALHGVALAGGYFRIAPGGSTAVETSREIARADLSTETLTRDLALLARLEAEHSDIEKIVPPKRLTEIAPPDRIDALLEAQTGLMAHRKAAFRNTLAAFDAGIVLVQEEIAALEQQNVRMAEQVRLAQNELETLRDLSQRGLSRRTDLFAVERAVANVQSTESDVSARIARAKKTMADAERDKMLLRINHKLAIEQEIVTLTDRIVNAEMAIRSANRILADIAGITSQRQPIAATKFAYEIIRADGLKQAVIQADESTPLCPGDILQIQPAN